MLRVLLQKIQRGPGRSSLARELTWTLVLKTAALIALWWVVIQPGSNAPPSGEAFSRYLFDPPAAQADSVPAIKASDK